MTRDTDGADRDHPARFRLDLGPGDAGRRFEADRRIARGAVPEQRTSRRLAVFVGVADRGDGHVQRVVQLEQVDLQAIALLADVGEQPLDLMLAPRLGLERALLAPEQRRRAGQAGDDQRRAASAPRPGGAGRAERTARCHAESGRASTASPRRKRRRSSANAATVA